MKRSMLVGVLLIALTICVSGVMGQAKKKPFVYVPFSKVQLTDEQAEKISTIQAEIRGKIKALEEEEYTRCSEVLTAEQKSQLAALEEADKAKARERSKAAYQKRKAEAEAQKKAPTN